MKLIAISYLSSIDRLSVIGMALIRVVSNQPSLCRSHEPD